MLDFLTKFLSPKMLPDLDTYRIQERPRRGITIKNEQVKGNVFAGKAWQTEWNEKGMTSNSIGAEVPATFQLVTLDAYDVALLDYVLTAGWKRDEARAKVMKWHWMREESAQKIQEYHTANGKLERGYSERTAADYIQAFYLADDEREKAGESRIRTAPNNATTANQYTWEK